MARGLAMLLALVLGGLLTPLSAYSFLIRWILVFMLWSGFLAMPFSSLRVERSHLRLLAAWAAFPALGWLLLRPLGHEAAIAGLLVGATPTATAAPTITRLLGGDPGYVTVSFLGSNLLAMFAIPLVLVAVGAPLPDGAGRFLLENVGIVAVPLFVATLCHRLGWAPRLAASTSKAVFPLWVFALSLASAKTVAFLSRSHHAPLVFAGIVAGSGALCAGHFLSGRRIGGRERALEAGQSLGQKNTMLTLWLGLSSFGPLAALGPASYVLWHNLWNAFQLARSDTSVRK